MRVLVSNDDGVDAPGIRILAEGLRSAGHEVYVVAPDRDRSGASNSLTLDLPIRLKRIDHYTCSVAGTPTVSDGGSTSEMVLPLVDAYMTSGPEVEPVAGEPCAGL